MDDGNLSTGRSGLSLRLLIGIGIAAVSAISYFGVRSKNEITGDVQHIRIEPSQEVAIGLAAAPEMERQFGGELNDAQLAAYVSEVGQGIVARSDAARTPYKYQFHVLADPETINAFALPGGQVFITWGLLRRLRSEAELAGVLGHEAGHVAARHSAEHLAKEKFAAGLVGAAGVASYDPNDPSHAQRNAAIAAAAAHVVTLRFGRQDELEADALGVRFMKQARYDPEGMAELMQILEKAGGGRRAPEFFSTHPNPENRLERIRAEIKEAGGPGGERGEERFRQKVLSRSQGVAGSSGADRPKNAD